MPSLGHYLARLRNLNRDPTHAWSSATQNRAPHKPLLLLSILDGVEEGALTRNFIEVTPELAETFGIYWSKVMLPNQRGSMAKPFFHLRGDGFWHLVPQPGHEDILKALKSVDSLSRLRAVVAGARLDEEMWALVCDPRSRDKMRAAITESCFAPELGTLLWQQSAVNIEASDYATALLNSARTHRTADLARQLEDKPAVRNQGFRRAVVTAYDRRCAVCGIRITTPEAHTVVDAAHIQPWSVGHNDDPRNGLALCRLCHWGFDEGLMGVSRHYVVTVSRLIGENDNLPGHLVMLRDREIFKPQEDAFWPDTEMLAWHSKHVFRKL